MYACYNIIIREGMEWSGREMQPRGSSSFLSHVFLLINKLLGSLYIINFLFLFPSCLPTAAEVSLWHEA